MDLALSSIFRRLALLALLHTYSHSTAFRVNHITWVFLVPGRCIIGHSRRVLPVVYCSFAASGLASLVVVSVS